MIVGFILDLNLYIIVMIVDKPGQWYPEILQPMIRPNKSKMNQAVWPLMLPMQRTIALSFA